MKIDYIFARLALLILLTTAIVFVLSDTVKSSEPFYYSIHISLHKTLSDAESSLYLFRPKGHSQGKNNSKFLKHSATVNKTNESGASKRPK